MPTKVCFAKAGLDILTSPMCKHQLQFGHDIQCSALVPNFNNIFSNKHLFWAGQLTVSNPNIGYGRHVIKYADGKTREFYQIGISANKTGISIYIHGIDDKTYLAKTYGKKIGKASVTGHYIKFKTLKDINIEILEAAIRYGVEPSLREQQQS